MSTLSKSKPYKEDQFDIFLSLIANPHSAPLMKEIAAAVGVAQETISDWNKRPEAIRARTEGLAHMTEQMRKVGKKDWKMWEKQLAIAGVSATQNVDVKSGGEPLKGLIVVKDNNDSPE